MGKWAPLLAATAPLVSALLYAAWDETSGLPLWRRLSRDVARAEAQVERLQIRNARLAADIEALGSDPFALERAIREEIGWVRPGEVRIDIRPREEAPLSAP